ncbi:unnamed protein product [Cuscuta epithymum]|uniref:Uncharacterized protein n=1 Tax=Cuscuta epithymum TaxID=186058 RepID=A0AAV0G3E0_9ASTE|nr:unnamed protein product [Cuscuta epithymum]CAH9142467.1 unnamed protein product [Cuscuta epithymum]
MECWRVSQSQSEFDQSPSQAKPFLETKGSKYFHQAVKQRRRRNKLKGILSENGTWITDMKQMGHVIVSSFGELFTSNRGRLEPGSLQGLAQVSGQQNFDLLRPITDKEVKKAVFAMHPDKAPGPDDLSSTETRNEKGETENGKREKRNFLKI